jgi:hypothetical protein
MLFFYAFLSNTAVWFGFLRFDRTVEDVIDLPIRRIMILINVLYAKKSVLAVDYCNSSSQSHVLNEFRFSELATNRRHHQC